MMRREDIDLIQRWIYFDGMTDQEVHDRIALLNVKVDVSVAIKLAKMQKQYESGQLSLEELQAAYSQYNIDL